MSCSVHPSSLRTRHRDRTDRALIRMKQRAKKDVSSHVRVDDSVRIHRSHIRDSCAGYVGTTQEEQNRDAIRSAPERKPWMPSLIEQREWYGHTTGGCQIPLFGSSRTHDIDVSAKNHRTEHKVYINVFFRHRWIHFNKKTDTHSLVPAWTAFIANILTVG